MRRYPKESLEYDRVEVQASRDGLPRDPTTGTPTFAYMKPNVRPGDLDWLDGEWEDQTPEQEEHDVYQARILRGPAGDIELAVGVWSVWFKCPEAPEEPQREAFLLEIY